MKKKLFFEKKLKEITWKNPKRRYENLHIS